MPRTVEIRGLLIALVIAIGTWAQGDLTPRSLASTVGVALCAWAIPLRDRNQVGGGDSDS